MKKINWQVKVALALIATSIIVYLIHYTAFHDSHHIFIYLVGDIAFVPIEVLLVTLFIHRLLTIREKRALMQKMNMVIGAFFSEVGIDLLKFTIDFDPDPADVIDKLIISNDWSGAQFRVVTKAIQEKDYRIDSLKGDLPRLRDFLVKRRDFMLRLLENPNLLEHDSFTNLLWAVFHLTEELAHRDDLSNLPPSDYTHLAGDIKRTYAQLILQWLAYMKHLKESYPYLFSLALRTNPFDRSASPVVVG